MSKHIVEVIKALPELIALKPATFEQINDAENELKLHFAEEYKDYLKEFGSIIALGFELSGIAKSAHRNVVSLTKQERELNPKVPCTMYVIENTCIDGIIIWQDTDGLIYKTRPNGKPVIIANSLAEYVGSRMVPS